MKKLIALALCLMLLLSGCGYSGSALVEIRDLYITDTDTTVDLRGLSGGVELGCSGDIYGLRLTVSADDELKNEMVVAVVEDNVLFLLNGGTGEPYAYAIDDPQVVGPIQQAFSSVIAAEGTFADEDVDIEGMTDEELDEYMAQLEEQLQSMTEGEDTDPEAADEAAAMAQRAAEILQSCVSEGEPMQFDGETYETVNFDLPHDELMELLGSIDTAQYMGEDVDLAQLLDAAGVTLDVTGVIAANEDGTKSAYGITPVFTNADGEVATLNITLQQTSEDGSLDFYLDINNDGQDLGSVSLTFNVQLLDEADWLPEGLGEDVQKVDLNDEASSEAFADALADFLGQVVGTAAGLTAGNGAIGALD